MTLRLLLALVAFAAGVTAIVVSLLLQATPGPQ